MLTIISESETVNSDGAITRMQEKLCHGNCEEPQEALSISQETENNTKRVPKERERLQISDLEAIQMNCVCECQTVGLQCEETQQEHIHLQCSGGEEEPTSLEASWI